MSRFLILILIFSAIVAHAQVPIIIKELKGIERKREPVTLGIPFSKGELNSETISLTDASGHHQPAQFKTTAYWNDGSIKWIKCDFQADVNANSQTEYYLMPNSALPVKTELSAFDNGFEITVITGPLKFIINKNSFNLFEKVWLDMNNDRVYSTAEEIVSPGYEFAGVNANACGIVYSSSASPPSLIEIEETGPMKTVIKIEGKHSNRSDYLLKYETRIYAFAGKSYLKIYHAYANGNSMPALNNPAGIEYGAAFDNYSMDFQINLSGLKKVKFGGSNGSEFMYNLTPGKGAQIIQNDRMSINTEFSYSIYEDNIELSNGSRAEGWGDLSDDKWGALVSCRYFWQKYPKGISLNDSGNICVKLSPTDEFFWAGMGTADEIFIYFHPASEYYNVKLLAEALSKNPLFAYTSPDQFMKSNVFYSLKIGADTPFPGMTDYINQVTDNHLSNIEALQLYGNINYGDVSRDKWEVADFRDESTWGNNYYDGILTMIRLFAQTGDLRYPEIFIPMTRHFIETDCWNTYDPDDWLNGFCPAYSSYHRESANFNAHFGEGVWYYYYLTGDERAKEIGLRAANSIVYRQGWANENTNCRMAYQRGSVCIEAFKLTRNPVYLQMAKHLIIDKILSTQDTYGVLGGVDDENNIITGEQSWMMALFSDALWKYLQEEYDEQAASKLCRLADFIDIYSRVNPHEEDYWNLFLPPDYSNPPTPVTDYDEPKVYWTGKGLIAGTYAYAYDLSGNERYKNLSRNLLTDIWNTIDQNGMEFWGKASSLAMKNIIHAAAIVYSDSITDVNYAAADQNAKDFQLFQNYPNPFNPKTIITYQLPVISNVIIRIYDILGNEAAVLINETKEPGVYYVEFNGSNLSSGVYFYQLRAGNFTTTKKFILVK